MSGIDRALSRIKSTSEVFTPTLLVQEILNNIPETAFTDHSKIFLDNSCGDGQFLSEIIIKKIENGSTFEQALNTIRGIDIMPDNIQLCHTRLLCGREDLRGIIEKHVIVADGLRYHYRFDGSHPYDDEVQKHNIGLEPVKKKPKRVTAKQNSTTIANTGLFSIEE
jgi:hypothetical protein